MESNQKSDCSSDSLWGQLGMSTCTHLFDLLCPQPIPDSRQVPPRARPHGKIPTSGCFWGISPGMSSTAQSAPRLTPSLLRGLGVWQGSRLPRPCLKLPSPCKRWLGSQGCLVTHSLTCTRAGGRGTVVKGPARHTARGWLSQDQKPEGRAGVLPPQLPAGTDPPGLCASVSEAKVTGAREEQRPGTTACGTHFP